MPANKYSSGTIRRPGPVLSALSLLLALFLAVPPRFTLLASDILRGGSPGSQAHGSAAGNPTAAAVQSGPNNARDSLARTTQTLTAMQAMQAAARAAARTGANNLGLDPNHPGQQLPNVPNGLVLGGLQVAPGVPVNLAHPTETENPSLWQGASLPRQTTSGGRTNVTIVQNTQQALLNWTTFNIGRDTHLLFDQTAGGANASQWIVFNTVSDPSGVPSQILGSLDAIGQIYLINANGIIFGGSSQINLHTLVASALPINDNLIARGLLNNPDNQFLFSALPLSAGGNGGGTPAFTPPPPLTPDGRVGDVVVQAGAQISAPTSADHVGGRVALVGANVRNQGTISTPDGQTILAAGLQVGLVAHPTNDPSLRGLDVYVGAVVDPLSSLSAYAGTAMNSGLIDAVRANVTIAGKTVDQLGVINSSTSVSLNGRIDLLADYNAASYINTVPATNPPPFFYTSSGIVTLGPNSVTQVLPEVASTDRIIGTRLALPSQVNIQGLAAHGTADAILLAPGANVSIQAGTWISYVSGNPTSQFISSGGQIYLDAGAIIDVAGSQDIQASVTENIVAAQLLGPELANFPLQRNGALRGQTVYIDITRTGTYNGRAYVGTPLADLSGYVNLVQRTVGELTTNGGNVTLIAGDSVVLQPGSVVDVSGGWINFQGGIVRTTQVLSGGHVFDISQATPDRVYDGLAGGFTVTHPKWGIAETTTNPFPNPGRFEPGFLQGGNGGSLTITAPSLALDGSLRGNTVAGARQQTTPPAASMLALIFQAQDPTAPTFLPISPAPPNITFGSGTLAVVDPFALDDSGNPLSLRDDRREQVILSPDLVNADGFGNLRIDNRDGDVNVPVNVRLTTAVGGSIDIAAANLDIEGSIISPGGNLTFNVYDISRATLNALSVDPDPHTPPPDPLRGHFVLGSGALLSAAGMVTDLRADSISLAPATFTSAGGRISISSYDALLARGSVIDVSGGATVSALGQISYGAGGSISINAGQDLNIASILGGQLTLNSTLRGFSGGKGSSLGILAPFVQIGGTTTSSDALLLSPDFFNQGGFTNFAIAGLGAPTDQTDVFLPAVVIASGTAIRPVAQSLLARLDANGAGTIALTPTLLPEGVRAPISLSFRASGVRDPYNNVTLQQFVRGDFVMNASTIVETDPLGSVSISANTAAVLGSIITLGGNISISGGGNTVSFFSDQANALPTVDLGPASFLSTAGTTLLTPDPRGFRTGTVLAGGNITVSGNIVAERGSILDVSGATDVLDLAPGFSNNSPNGSLNGAQLIPTRVDSNGGSITLRGSQELFTDATFRGVAGGASATGGTLSISSSRFELPGVVGTPLDENIIVTQNERTIPASFYGPGENAIGHLVVDADGNPIFGEGYFAADAFNHSGLGSLVLQGTIQFSGPVRITANHSLAIANGGVIRADGNVNLSASYISLGTPFRPPFAEQEQRNAFTVSGQPFYFQPSFGTGNLTAVGSLIDIGNLSLQNIGNLNLMANNGDIRGDGTLDIAGNISITAGQIYPPTATQFTIAAYDYVSGGNSMPGTITLAASGTRPLPLSAGGQLNVYGSVIDDGGVLRAPIGTINIGLDETDVAPVDAISNLAVPSAQEVNLLAGSIASVAAVDPSGGNALTIPYGFNLNGTAWIDPAGNDITSGGMPRKSVTIAGANVSDEAGSRIDIRGGGDLFAYQFVSGTSGTIDVLNSSAGFAILPGRDTGYAPYAPYNDSSIFGHDQGYANGNLNVGDQIYLNGSSGLPAGTYTLLPARYALLPGAFLITPKDGTPVAQLPQPDGSTLISGYRVNGFNPPAGQPLFASFELAPSSVVRSRAQYNDYSANTYLRQAAISHDIAVPRLPIDSGRLLFEATETMSIFGSLDSRAPSGGRGGLVDISSPVDILIAGPGQTGTAGELVLDASALSAFGAESLLIGGTRQDSADGTAVTVVTNNVTIDNAAAPLSGPDVIVVANQNLTLATGANVTASGSLTTAVDSLVFGNADIAGSGDGVLLRVSVDPLAQIARFGVDSSAVPHEFIGANVNLAGASVTLDSTSFTSLSPTALLAGSVVNLDSGRISIRLPNGDQPPQDAGLVLAGVALQNLRSVQALSLLSYSSIDIYGTGRITASNSLALHAGEIRGFNHGGIVDFVGRTISLDNSANAIAAGAVATSNGTLQFDAETILFGINQIEVNQFANARFNASTSVKLQDSGSFLLDGDLIVTAPEVIAGQRATQIISATGAINLRSATSSSVGTTASALGSSLTIVGASVVDNINIALPSGTVTLHATDGNVTVGNLSSTTIDVGGTAQTFFDLVKYTSGGLVNLIADLGSVDLASHSSIDVAAQSQGGNAGSLSVAAPGGVFVLNGVLNGAGGVHGRNGNFALDVGSLPTLASLDAILNAASFTQSRSIRVRNGDVLVNGLATSQVFDLSADHGSIVVTGAVDASGVIGGSISLDASGSVILQAGSLLTAAAQDFDHAGKGGAIWLAAGSEVDGVIDSNAVLDLQTGSTINLSVANNNAALGDFTGTLHLRAPQIADNTDLQLNPINAHIIGASSIVVEGYELFDLTATGGAINSTVEGAVSANATAFIGADGVTTTMYTAMLNRLFAGNQNLRSISVIEAGAEIINRNGNLTLGTTSSNSTSNWDLSGYRFGPNSSAGVLTLRASGNLVFYNALSDGFASSAFDAELLAQNPLLAPNQQSWTYHLAAGADFAASDFHRVLSLDDLGPDSGSLLLGKDYGPNVFAPSGIPASTRNALLLGGGRYQVIRTGSGDIDIAAGRDVKLLNQFATIYTAGTRLDDFTLGGTFDLPMTSAVGQQAGNLGSIQQPIPYAAQYSIAGGNVTITAQEDIVHQTQVNGILVDDSSRELPINWLYRRGFVNPATGLFGEITRSQANDIGSTSWWIDFSNFFEGVGALGGGNVVLNAGHDVRNIDAVAPTNARMPGRDAAGNAIAPNAATLVELGGGDVTVRAGNNIDAGVYYVERGLGTLGAGNEIHTNATRSPSLTNIAGPPQILAEETWLPTTLFLGKGSFDVSAGNNVLLGPVANPFLLPAGINNSFWYKTYFSTFAPEDSVNVTSLNGNITLRESATLPGEGAASSLLLTWLGSISRFAAGTASFYQPWLRLSERDLTPFTAFTSLLPPQLRITAFSGDIDLVGDLTLFPSPVGTIDLVARGAINAVQPNGVATLGTDTVATWGVSEINLSDADPDRVPGIAAPFAFRTVVSNPTNAGSNQATNATFLDFVKVIFAETGSAQGAAAVLQNKQALHAAGLLHLNDLDPIHLYAGDGDISGLTLFSGKAARLVAGRDITDIALYIQNNRSSDLTLISAGRDLIAYNPNSALRVQAQAQGNILNLGADAAAGDIQINGPGTLEVLAGRNFDLGVGPNNLDGTAVGITSIGNARNPFLPFAGADIIASAGIGVSNGLAQSALNFVAFISQFLDPNSAADRSARYLPELGRLLGLTNASDAQIWSQFNQLPIEKRNALALDVFYLVLRDAGRDRNNPDSPNFGSFDQGYDAIAALFPGDEWHGDISLTSREIKTRNGGDISLFAPGGQLNVGVDVEGNQAADQGILTEHGGNISIFTDQSVNVGTSRIFTLRGGNEIIWSSNGDIAAGASSKTVQSAPPTRVLVDPQSGDVQTDLAGLATGGGIGVLESVAGVPPADIDLIAPTGTIDAGDAGIRVSGNLNLAAVAIINAGNIQVGGASAGVPIAAAPNLGSLTVASNTAGATSNAASDLANQNRTGPLQEDVPSIISVEVLGYGGGDEDEEERRRKKKEQQERQASAESDSFRVSQLQARESHAGSFR